MRIAIQATDLDFNSMGGIRTYLSNVLKRFGKLFPKDEFIIYHRKTFNPELIPPNFSNYTVKKAYSPFFWTQLRFAAELWKDAPDALWMPLHNIPLLRKKNLKTTVTVHDLAFKYFPDHFTGSDLKKLNFLTDIAIKHSDKIIAVSQSTKNDILKFYPNIKEDKIKVIYHGFDEELFNTNYTEEEIGSILSKFKIQNSKFILYVGTLQPRKNLEILIEAFDALKKNNPDLKLVLAGGKGWLWENILKRAARSPYRIDIILTGTVCFKDLAILYKNAAMFVFPSLYEGFGMPIIEAFASKIPVISAENSSLMEIGGDAALYFNEKDPSDLVLKMQNILGDTDVKNKLIKRGETRLREFSWDKCAKETVEFIKS